MHHKTTKPTAKARRAAAASSGPSLSPDAPAKAVANPVDGEIATRVAMSERGPAGAEASFGAEDQHPTWGPAPTAVGGNLANVAKPNHYEVVHTAVGGYHKGDRVEVGTFTDEQAWRLLAAGAIIPFKSRSGPWD